MGDYGSLVSQKGYDVKTAADRFLVYSSAFQTLKIYSVYSVTTTKPSSGSGDTNTATATHNLGYFCPFIVIYNGNTTEGVGSSYFFTDSVLPLSARGYTDRVEIDVDEHFDSGASDGDTIYFTVYVFLDDFRTVSENTINSGTTSGASSEDYGIRISKGGFDVKTCDDKDCVLSSSFANQIIHKKGSTTASSVSHNLGYIPNYLMYDNFLGGASYIEFTNPAFSGVTTTSLALRGSSTSYYIIFKDKLT